MHKMLQNTHGQTVMEYIIVTALVGVLCLSAVKKMGEVLDKRVEHIKQKIVEGIKIN